MHRHGDENLVGSTCKYFTAAYSIEFEYYESVLLAD